MRISIDLDLEKLEDEYKKYCTEVNEKDPSYIYGWNSNHVFEFLIYYSEKLKTDSNTNPNVPDTFKDIAYDEVGNTPVDMTTLSG